MPFETRPIVERLLTNTHYCTEQILCADICSIRTVCFGAATTGLVARTEKPTAVACAVAVVCAPHTSARVCIASMHLRLEAVGIRLAGLFALFVFRVAVWRLASGLYVISRAVQVRAALT